jgi:hypothetical protein
VRFIGERKGSVTIICDPATDYAAGGYDRYCQLVEKVVCADDGDEWSLEMQQGIGDGSSQIIHASKERVDAYLRGIEASGHSGRPAGSSGARPHRKAGNERVSIVRTVRHPPRKTLVCCFLQWRV